MALKPVTDPALLAQLGGAPTSAPASARAVTDPALLAQLNGDQSAAPNGGFLARLKGLAETGLNVATGGVAALGGGLNYAATLTATGNADAAKAVQEDTQQALTYAPRTAEGQRYSGNVGEALSYLGQKQGEFLGERSAGLASRLGASPEAAGAIGATVNTGIQAIPQVIGLRGMRGKPAQAAAPKPNAGINLVAQIDKARSLGYKVPPRLAGAVGGAVAEGIAGSAKLERGISVANQKVTQRLAREEIGLKGNTPISPAELDMLRKKHNSAYEDLSKSGRIAADEQFARDMFSVGERTSSMMKDFPEAASPAIEKLRNSYLTPEFDAASAVQATRKLRADAKKYLKAFDDPEKQALGMASREIADAFDGALQRHAEALGDPGLATRFQNARQQLAKIYSVDAALNESTGNVSAGILGRQLDRGAPLSGNLREIAETARRFGKAVQDVDKLPGRSVEFGDLMLGGGAAGAGALAGGTPLLGLAAVGARPGLRSILQSDLYQNQLGSGGVGTRNMLLRAGGVGTAAGAVAPKPERR